MRLQRLKEIIISRESVGGAIACQGIFPSGKVTGRHRQIAGRQSAYPGNGMCRCWSDRARVGRVPSRDRRLQPFLSVERDGCFGAATPVHAGITARGWRAKAGETGRRSPLVRMTCTPRSARPMIGTSGSGEAKPAASASCPGNGAGRGGKRCIAKGAAGQSGSRPVRYRVHEP